jgi:hypothetical protein
VYGFCVNASALPPPAETIGIEGVTAIVALTDGQVLHRITADDVPAIRDFLSNRDLWNIPMKPEHWLFFNGISMFEERSQAESMRDRFRPGQHVTEVPLPARQGFTLAKTRSAGHYTVWGNPETLLTFALEHGGYPADRRPR